MCSPSSGRASSPRSTSSDGTLVNPFPPLHGPRCPLMRHEPTIPFYASDGASLGYRSPEAANGWCRTLRATLVRTKGTSEGDLGPGTRTAAVRS